MKADGKSSYKSTIISRSDRAVRTIKILTVNKKHDIVSGHTGWFEVQGRSRTCEEVGAVGLQSDYHEPDQCRG